MRVDDFDDVEQLKEASGNEKAADGDFLQGRINQAYLQGFLAAGGTKPTMFANHYPVEDALKLFGAMPGYGAQLPKN